MVYFIVDTHPEQFLEKCYIKRDAFVWPPSKQNKDGYTVTLLEKSPPLSHSSSIITSYHSPFF